MKTNFGYESAGRGRGMGVVEGRLAVGCRAMEKGRITLGIHPVCIEVGNDSLVANLF